MPAESVGALPFHWRAISHLSGVSSFFNVAIILSRHLSGPLSRSLEWRFHLRTLRDIYCQFSYVVACFSGVFSTIVRTVLVAVMTVLLAATFS